MCSRAEGVRRTKVGLVSLGCDKNTVDSERILAALAGHGAEPTSELSEADVILVNTCGFIDAAKEESIETLLELGRHKEEGRCQALVALGCLVERHRDELEPSLPEVDLFVGLRDTERLLPELRGRGLLGAPLADHPGVRVPLTDRRHVRYLKVSEGCDHGCAFCAIPLWRGRHRSFGPERLAAEAARLEAQGAVELNLVAQDLAHYGREWRNGEGLVSLLRRMLDETSVPWLRLLYIYSAGLRPPLIDLMATEDRVLSYIDMPIQHASDPVLARMRRPERRETLLRRIEHLRAEIPDLTLRTTVLVGFPGETDEDFRALLDFLDEVRFDRLGAFAFSPQEGTRAAGMEELFVPCEVARDRLEELIEFQSAISGERLSRQVGCEVEAILDRRIDGGWEGRIRAQADDVDGVTQLADGGSEEKGIGPGAFVRATIESAGDHDLSGRIAGLSRPAPGGSGGPAASPARRPLPVAPLGLDTGWGR
jgi:ribosomal protein S12 methylthiotransferase